MAGDWIKMRVNLSTDPAVKAMARNLKIDAFSVVGRLHTFWAWADEHTENGEIPWVTFKDIDDLVSKRGFAAQLELVGWLINLGEAIRLPNFDRHNGDSAKRRVMETEKKRRQRNGDRKPDDCPDDVPIPSGQKQDTTGTREEKRREEKSIPIIAPGSGAPAGGFALEQDTPPPPPVEKTKAQRPRNLLLDALAACGGADPLQIVPSAWGSVVKALADIKAVCPDLTPDEIQRRSTNYRSHMRDATLTPNALAKNWALCDRPGTPQPTTPARVNIA